MLRRCVALVGVAFVGLAAGHEHRHEHHHNHKHDKELNCWEEDIFAFCMANVDDDMAADKRKYKFVRSKWRCFPLLEDYRSCQLSVDDETKLVEESTREGLAEVYNEQNHYLYKKTQLIYQCYNCVRTKLGNDKDADQTKFDLRKALPTPCAFTKPKASQADANQVLCQEQCVQKLSQKWHGAPFSDWCAKQELHTCARLKGTTKNPPKANKPGWKSFNLQSYYRGTDTKVITAKAKKVFSSAKTLLQDPWARDADACYCLKQCKAKVPKCTVFHNTLYSEAETNIFRKHSHICCQTRDKLELEFAVISKTSLVYKAPFDYIDYVKQHQCAYLPHSEMKGGCDADSKDPFSAEASGDSYHQCVKATAPTPRPTGPPTDAPTKNPTHSPTTPIPTNFPTPTIAPTSTDYPTKFPTDFPTPSPVPPTPYPTWSHTTMRPTGTPSAAPTAPTSTPTHAPTASPTEMPTSTPTHHTQWMPPTAAPTGDCSAENTPMTCLDQEGCSWCSGLYDREKRYEAYLQTKHCFANKDRPGYPKATCTGEVELKKKKLAAKEDVVCSMLNSARCIKYWDCKWCHVPSRNENLCLPASEHLPFGLGYCHPIRRWMKENEIDSAEPVNTPAASRSGSKRAVPTPVGATPSPTANWLTLPTQAPTAEPTAGVNTICQDVLDRGYWTSCVMQLEDGGELKCSMCLADFASQIRQQVAGEFMHGVNYIKTLRANGGPIPDFKIFAPTAKDQATILYYLHYFGSPDRPVNQDKMLARVEREGEDGDSAKKILAKWLPYIKKFYANGSPKSTSERRRLCSVATVAEYCTEKVPRKRGATNSEEKDSWFEKLKATGSGTEKSSLAKKVAIMRHGRKGARHHTSQYDDDFDDDDDKADSEFNLPKHRTGDEYVSEYNLQRGMGTHDVPNPDFEDTMPHASEGEYREARQLYDDDDNKLN